MSKQVYLEAEKGADCPETYIALGDDVLSAIWSLVERREYPRTWALVGDLYGDASFDTTGARELAEELTDLAGKAPGMAAAWLRILAAVARSASDEELYIIASAD